MVHVERATEILEVFDFFRNELRHRYPPRSIEPGGAAVASATLTSIYFAGAEVPMIALDEVKPFDSEELARVLETRQRLMRSDEPEEAEAPEDDAN